ncbi:tetratricopeptide repeat protein 22-like [Acanthaster planci]|uniref:Tetratricopeptide repeat protein 22-like n=1 Tax=Acanthaster planci TaxID=133434 RepID=A0A8B7XWU4_ACAPL|nr:tetratricopeptide repeat protein 22-like [Acanthaster planci]
MIHETEESGSATMSSAEAFGHFLLPLTMNKGHIEAKEADYVFKVRGAFLDMKKERPERHALRNLLGMLAFRTGQLEEAFEYLDKILSEGEDPHNLNALANRKYMCERLLRYPEARDCERRIAALIKYDGTEGSQKRSKKLRARSLAEQAFAYSFELFWESVSVERYCKSVDLYDQAIRLAGHLIDQNEEEDWLSVNGMACHKIYNKCKYDKSMKDKEKTWFEKAVQNFASLVRKSRDCSLVSEGWRHLGELFGQVKKSPQLLPSIPQNMRKYVSEPRKCFEEAMKISPQDARILARYAAFHQRNRNYTQALSMVNESLEWDKTEFNQHAYYVRATIWLNKYKKQPASNLLQRAEQDLRTVLKKSSTPWHFKCLAEVLYYKAMDQNSELKQENEKQINLQLALTYCAKALICQDGKNRAENHKLRGDCLCEMGEHQAALGCYRRALECEIGTNSVMGSGGNSLVTEFHHILKDNATLSENKKFLRHMVYWLYKAAEFCLSNDLILLPLKKLKDLAGLWESFAQFCDSNKYNSYLEIIELAATDKTSRQRQHAASRMYSVPEFQTRGDKEKSVLPKRPQRYSESQGLEVERTVFDTFQSTEELDMDVGAFAGPSGENVLDSPDRSVRTAAKSLSEIDRTTTPSPPTPLPGDGFQQQVRDAPEKPLNQKGLMYDFFVIYSSNASEWVKYCMLEELEEDGFKGCIKDRDFILGKPKKKNYVNSIQKSTCTIIVITADFREDKDAHDAMYMALDSSPLVIPVLREATGMPPELKHIAYLDATGVVDWALLKRSIEQQVKLDVAWDG